MRRFSTVCLFASLFVLTSCQSGGDIVAEIKGDDVQIDYKAVFSGYIRTENIGVQSNDKNGLGCTLAPNGVFCWQRPRWVNPAYNNNKFEDLEFIKIPALQNTRDISANCALSEKNTIQCWFENGADAKVPSFPDERIQSIHANFYMNCSLDVRGNVVCWNNTVTSSRESDTDGTCLLSDESCARPTIRFQEVQTVEVPKRSFQSLYLQDEISCGTTIDTFFCWGNDSTGRMSKFKEWVFDPWIPSSIKAVGPQIVHVRNPVSDYLSWESRWVKYNGEVVLSLGEMLFVANVVGQGNGDFSEFEHWQNLSFEELQSSKINLTQFQFNDYSEATHPDASTDWYAVVQQVCHLDGNSLGCNAFHRAFYFEDDRKQCHASVLTDNFYETTGFQRLNQELASEPETFRNRCLFHGDDQK